MREMFFVCYTRDYYNIRVQERCNYYYSSNTVDGCALTTTYSTSHQVCNIYVVEDPLLRTRMTGMERCSYVHNPV